MDMITKLNEFTSHLDEAGGTPADLADRVVLGDCLEALRHFVADSVDLVHTSPPYNIDKAYKGNHRDLRAQQAYLAFLHDVVTELKRVLKPHGSLFWQTGYTQLQNGVSGDILPIDIVTYPFFRESPNEMVLWDRIIWRYFGGLAFKKKFTNKHETILWFVKPNNGEANPYFEVDSIRERSRELDKRNNFWGRNPGNVWEVDRVAYGTTEQSSHIAVYPEEITEKIIRAASKPGDIVLDPFSGSGTTPKVARSLGRHWLGIEISPEYAHESVRRIGFQQPSEAAALCSSLVKAKAFGGKAGSLPIAEILRRLRIWARSVDLTSQSQLLRSGIRKALRSSNGKDAKPEVWESFDNVIASNSKDPVVEADSWLCADYKNRRSLNGVRRFQTALQLLTAVHQNIFSATDKSLTTLLEQLAADEPSSYKIARGSIRLAAADKRLKPPVRGNGSSATVRSQSERPSLDLRTQEYQPSLLPRD